MQAKQNPKNDPTVRVYQHIEDQLTRAGSEADDILALTTTREGATNLRNYFSIAGKKANAETAVKVAGATAKHCIVIHGDSTFLSGEGRNLDYDQECFTRANVAYSRATDLTILACPLNMQGMPGALQVLAALLHGVQTIHTCDSNKEPNIVGSLDLTVTQVEQATTFFQQALLPHPMWCGPLPVCLVEHHHGKVRRLRLVLATITHLTKAEINILHNSSGPGRRCSVGSSLRYQPTPSMREQRSAQDYAFEALHRVYFYDAWRAQPVLDAIGSDLILPSRPGLLCMAAAGLGQVCRQMSSLSLIATQTTRNTKLKKDICHPLLQRQMMQWLRKPHKTSSWSTAPHLSRPPSRAQSNQRTMMPTWKILIVPAALPQKRVIASQSSCFSCCTSRARGHAGGRR